MDDMENKLGAILNDPEMMRQIMNLAQNLSTAPAEVPPAPAQGFPDIDISTLQKISGAVGQAGIDPKQKSLLSALSPYVSSRRIGKLERAMRAAKMANMAGIFRNPSGR